jgi:putative transposase
LGLLPDAERCTLDRGSQVRGRLASFVLDEAYLLACARYVELNPIRAGLGTAPSEYRWSSAAAHIKRKEDCLVQAAPLLSVVKNGRKLLNRAVTEEQIKTFREHERTGRALGAEDFQKRLEKKLGRVLRRQKPGPKKGRPK